MPSRTINRTLPLPTDSAIKLHAETLPHDLSAGLAAAALVASVGHGLGDVLGEEEEDLPRVALVGVEDLVVPEVPLVPKPLDGLGDLCACR